MKAVIVELNNNRAAVLSDDGCIITVKNKNYELGQVIQLKNRKVSIPKKLMVSAASAAAILLFGTGTWAYASPYTYVSLDVNPSIEYTVNRFDRVIRVKAVNDDGEEILKELTINELTNQSIGNAVKATVNQLSESGYFDTTSDGGIVIATSSRDTQKADELAQDLQETIEEQTVQNGDAVTVDAFSVAMERVEEAKDLGVTPGKLNLVEMLQEAAGSTAEINLNEWLDKPVKDIMKAANDYKKAAKTSDVKEQKDNKESADAEHSEDSTVSGAGVSGEADADASTTKGADQKNQEKDAKTTGSENQPKQKEEDKAQKETGKETDKAQKDTDKAQKDSNKKTDKTQKDAEKEADKEQKDNGKSSDKPQKVNENSSDNLSIDNGKSSDKAQKDIEKDADKARKDIEKSSDNEKKDTEEASELEEDYSNSQKDMEKTDDQDNTRQQSELTGNADSGTSGNGQNSDKDSDKGHKNGH